jgi:hypothetical protein
MELQRLMNASAPPREDIAHMARDIWIMDMERMVYLWDVDINRDQMRDAN